MPLSPGAWFARFLLSVHFLGRLAIPTAYETLVSVAISSLEGFCVQYTAQELASHYYIYWCFFFERERHPDTLCRRRELKYVLVTTKLCSVHSSKNHLANPGPLKACWPGIAVRAYLGVEIFKEQESHSGMLKMVATSWL